MRPIRIIVAPFHAGSRAHRVGKGPHYLLGAGLPDALAAQGAAVDVVEIAPVDAFEGEIGRSFEVKRRVSTAVATAVDAGRLPLVLAGNCNTSVGVYAGLGESRAGVVWFDAQADFYTPDDERSGYFDSMGVATLAGQCWQRLAATIPGFRPFDLSRLVYCGFRSSDEAQRTKIEAHRIATVYGSADRDVAFADELDAALGGFGTERALVHLDLDCLDTSVGQANEYALPGGLDADDLAACFERVVARVAPAALTIASFNPDLAGHDEVAAAAIRAATIVARASG